MAVTVTDRWHKSRPKAGETTCKEHKGLVPTTAHGKGERWQVRWDEWKDGVRHQPRRNFRFKVGKDPEIHADAFADKLRIELDRPKDAGTLSAITVSAVTQKWIDSRDVAESTKANLQVRFNKHIHRNPIGDLPVMDLFDDPNLIQLWVKGMRENGMASSTAREMLHKFSSILNYAAYVGAIPSNPIPNNPVITVPPPSKKTVIPYTAKQLDSINANLIARYRVVLEVGKNAGLRIGEIYGLSPDDIQGKDLHVRRQIRKNDKTRTDSLVFALPKGGKTRIVPIPDSLIAFLETLPTSPVTLPWEKATGQRRTVRVYMATAGRLFDMSALTRAWYLALKQAGIIAVPYEDRFHRLRHTYASQLLRARVDIRSLAYYLGHDDPGFTLRRYCHFMLGDGDDVRRAIDG